MAFTENNTGIVFNKSKPSLYYVLTALLHHFNLAKVRATPYFTQTLLKLFMPNIITSRV